MSDEQHDELDALIRGYYGSQELADDAVDAILHRAAHEDPQQPTIPVVSHWQRNWSRRQWLQAAGMGAVFVLGSAVLHRQVSRQGVREMLLDELVLNHREALKLDVAADSFVAVQEALVRLAFEIRVPQHLVAGYELLGGRYCSLLGNLAVQLKFRDSATGRIDTLFLTPMAEEFGAPEAQQTRLDGIAITTGADAELFYGHTRQISP